MSRFHRLNLTDPVRSDHPLNIGRVCWFYTPNESGWGSGYIVKDLMQRLEGTITPGAVATPDWSTLPNGTRCVKWETGGSTDGYIDIGGAATLDFTDDFTVACSFVTTNLAPSHIGGLAGLVNKYNTPAANEWSFRQHNATLEFGGSTLAASGSILNTYELYRAVAVMKAGTATIYLNGSSVASGAVAISSGADSVLIGNSYLPQQAVFYGWIGDVSVWERPLSELEVLLDAHAALRDYRVENSPLRFLDSRQIFAADGTLGPAVFETSATDTNLLVYANVARFTVGATARSSGTGLGALVPTGPADFDVQAMEREVIQGGVPTLVHLTVSAGETDALAAGSPVSLTVSAQARHAVRSVPNGDLRILSQGRYRR